MRNLRFFAVILLLISTVGFFVLPSRIPALSEIEHHRNNKINGDPAVLRHLAYNWRVLFLNQVRHKALQQQLQKEDRDQLFNPNLIINQAQLSAYSAVTGNAMKSAGKYVQANNKLIEAVKSAYEAGSKAWAELDNVDNIQVQAPVPVPAPASTDTECPQTVTISREDMNQLSENGDLDIKLPCGLASGSVITVVGKPLRQHLEEIRSAGKADAGGTGYRFVSDFVFEIYGRRHAVYEPEPPTLLYINTRLSGDWSDKPVIEFNTNYKGQWGRSQRCDGTADSPSTSVDGFPSCEEWSDRSFPFVADQQFVMTVRAGDDGFHVAVDGRHVASKKHSTALIDEVAAGFSFYGDVEIEQIVVTALPAEAPAKEPVDVLKTFDESLKAPALTKESTELFIGLLSATDHFEERMAIRKSWFQSRTIQHGQVVSRFFLALGLDQQVNLQVRKEAELFGDIVVLPFIDNYDLVVFKTLEICNYGVNSVWAKYVMKSDDDSFIHVDKVLKMLEDVSSGDSSDIYIGRMNVNHKALRSGKWAVTIDEWPEDFYPTYANGAGYIVSRDIAKYVVTQSKRNALKLFRMEDVNMGLFVEEYDNQIGKVRYFDAMNFNQLGCGVNYALAHYQSPRQMVCLHEKILKGDLQCCY